MAYSADRFGEAVEAILSRIAALEKTILESRKAPVLPPNESLLNAKQAGEYLHKARQTIYGLVYRGKIPHLGSGKHLRFLESDLKNWLKTG